MEKAPFFSNLADGPAGGDAYWLTADDGVRLRIGVWPKGEMGTVLLFPGRTEWVEKYGRAAADFSARGFAMLSVDWRGQGIADRLLDNRAIGHVADFADYQRDVRAVVAAAEKLDLPRPYFLCGHSMGGAIGLRALHDNIEVKAVAFSAPMWGIRISTLMRPLAVVLSALSRPLGFSGRLTPGTTELTYVLDAPFDDNTLTTDRDMWDYMVGQLRAQPDFALGGPSFLWLKEALKECRNLVNSPAPDVPCITFLGSNERIVDVPCVPKVMDKWATGELVMIDGAEHEVLMETPARRKLIFDRMAALFEAHR